MVNRTKFRIACGSGKSRSGFVQLSYKQGAHFMASSHDLGARSRYIAASRPEELVPVPAAAPQFCSYFSFLFPCS